MSIRDGLEAASRRDWLTDKDIEAADTGAVSFAPPILLAPG